MISKTLTEVEERLRLLTPSELTSVERLIRGLRKSSLPPMAERRDALARMAADPQIRGELAAIDTEFAVAEMDGLENTE